MPLVCTLFVYYKYFYQFFTNPTFVLVLQHLFSHGRKLAEELSQKAIHTLSQVKHLLNESFTHMLAEQLFAGQQAIVRSANYPEGREGLAAFVEKRKPDFMKMNI